ncbi:hypothetical protein E4K67_27285 [Desulfosporosinus fructosivorans]|uniref:Uncharacterized protein n=1 Tax=Desulfosporosinus fructosivorans TaxID=2018669 RepID=A0A4Z0QW85_9FIRM|nr:hypothetical protein [Desulfosporosinus fructosivorans]TGE35101.1 hypothetical protein E4K67_27285 [Desulfosporosinus fructosivorans]
MEIFDIAVNGSGFDRESNFNNYALTLVLKDDEAEKTVRANLRYYPLENEWDLNPIFYEYTKDEKKVMIDQIIESESFKSAFETTTIHLEG